MPNQPRAIKPDRQNRHAAPHKKTLPTFHSDSHTPPSLLETQHQSRSSRPAQNIIGNHLPVIRTTENRTLLGELATSARFSAAVRATIIMVRRRRELEQP